MDFEVPRAVVGGVGVGGGGVGGGGGGGGGVQVGIRQGTGAGAGAGAGEEGVVGTGVVVCVRVYDKERVQRKRLLGGVSVPLEGVGGRSVEGWYVMEGGECVGGEVYLRMEVWGEAEGVDGVGGKGGGGGGGGGREGGNPFGGADDDGDDDD